MLYIDHKIGEIYSSIEDRRIPYETQKWLVSVKYVARLMDFT